ncbi:uncharacterized protein [Coffea arabica]|uniref:Tf2-1-like SH3-like domain-containing protein n=1 Tax=Coffea arabica TaxID=13443 RepID=A0ABM4VMF2_COFAR
MKLAAKYYGPYQVEKKIGSVAYRLKLPQGAAIHPIFHVSLLKPTTKGTPINSELPQVSDEGFYTTTPTAVLDRRMIDRDGQQVGQVLICWKNMNEEDATWEDLTVIQSQFLSFNSRD